MSGMSKSNKPIIVVIQVLLLMVIAFYFLKFGNEHKTSFIAIDAKQFFGDHDEAFRNLNQKKITQLIDEHLSVLKEMEKTIKRIYVADLKLKEEIEKTHGDDKKRRELLDDISRFEDDLKKLKSNCYLNKDRLFPEITDSFIGRGPIMALKTYSSDNGKL